MGRLYGYFQPQLVVYNHQLVIYKQQKTQPLAWTGFIFMAKLIRLKLALIKLYWCQRVYARFPLNGVCGYVWFLG